MNEYEKGAIQLKQHDLFSTYHTIFLANWIEREHKLNHKQETIQEVIRDIISFSEVFMEQIKRNKRKGSC
mgnify:CR=1 FL=1